MPARQRSMLLLGALIALSALAFVRAEQLKLQRSPVGELRVGRHLSTACAPRCPSRAEVTFLLRDPGDVTVTMVDADGEPVRTLVDDRRLPEGRVRLAWDGRTDAGGAAPDGRYRPRVELHSLDRTITIPNAVVVDTGAPVITLRDAERRLAPGRLTVSLRYRRNEPGRTYVVVLGPGRRGDPGPFRRDLLERARSGRARIDARVEPGLYTLKIAGRDRAGNPAVDAPSIRVRVP